MRTIRLILASLILYSCSYNNNLPHSGAKANEVVLIDDKDSIILNQLDKKNEYQEPLFQILSVKNSSFNQILSHSHTIVRVITINNKENVQNRPKIYYQKDVYAHPQIVINIYIKDKNQLRHYADKLGEKLRDLLARHEINVEINHLKTAYNKKISKAIEEKFQMRMLIPQNTTILKETDDFIWITNREKQGNSINICVYSLPFHKRNEYSQLLDFARRRDSIMKSNIKGETEKNYMKTVRSTLKETKEFTYGPNVHTRIEGLWEMHNDVMGGPFIAHLLSDKKRRRIIVAEGFIYAPGEQKENYLRSLEAALYTLNFTKDGK